MFSEKIRQLRKDRHLTQAEVAKEVGLSAQLQVLIAPV